MYIFLLYLTQGLYSFGLWYGILYIYLIIAFHFRGIARLGPLYYKLLTNSLYRSFLLPLPSLP